MSADGEEIPTPGEVRSQLEKILDSFRFRKAATQSNILRFVVEMALSQQSIKGADIRAEIPGHFDVDSHKERANASIIRQKMDEYYLDEGKDDIVRIGFPPGPAYRPVFSYHVKAKAIRAYNRALGYKEQLSAYALSEAEGLLDKAIKLAPEFAPLFAAKAEICLLRFVLENIVGMYPGTFGWTSYARRSAENALRLDPKSWLGHVVLGVTSLTVYNFERARVKFSAAMELDPEKTASSLWYATYLMVIGRTDEALRIVESKAQYFPGSCEFRLVYAFFLYLTRSYRRAREVLYEVAGVGISWALQEYLAILLDMVTGNQAGSVPIALRVLSEQLSKQWDHPTTSLTHRVDVISYVPWSDGVSFPNLPFYVVELRSGNTMLARNPRYDPGERFPGLAVLALANAGNVAEANEKMTKLRKQRSVRPLQLVLGYTGTRNEARALASLRRAFRDGDMFVLWFHLLPIFDPLRAHPLFQEIATQFGRQQVPQSE